MENPQFCIFSQNSQKHIDKWGCLMIQEKKSGMWGEIKKCLPDSKVTFWIKNLIIMSFSSCF